MTPSGAHVIKDSLETAAHKVRIHNKSKSLTYVQKTIHFRPGLLSRVQNLIRSTLRHIINSTTEKYYSIVSFERSEFRISSRASKS